jgi:diguanylate cyclase (GGDEF)-like protein/PAS domain S-box-containing protein
MLRVLTCLTFEHNWWLVGLAGLICFIASYSVIDIGRHARAADGAGRLSWIVTAGTAAGFGIWATHFIAMLAYDPGVVAGYDVFLTVTSLLVAIAITSAGLMLGILWPWRWSSFAGGALVGVGVSAMHYLGMSALQIPGRITFAPDLVIASVVLGAVLAGTALQWARMRQDFIGALRGAGLLTLAICTMHFTAMGAVTVVPDPAQPMSAAAMPTVVMAYAVAVAAGLLISLGLFTVFISRRARAARAASERMFRILVEGVTDYALYMLHPDGRVANWNEGARRAKGYTAEEIVGEHFSRFYSAEDRKKSLPEKALQTALDQGRFEAEGWRLRKDGSRFWAHVVIEPIHDEQGTLIGFAKITRDVTAQKADRIRMQETSRRLDLALSNMTQGLCLFDQEERLVLVNKRLAEIFGVAAERIATGMTMRTLFEVIAPATSPENTAEAMYRRHHVLIEAEEASVLTEEFGHGQIISLSHRPIGDGTWVTTFEDITERRRSEAKIAHMARHDALTGLPNRVSFNERVDRALAEPKAGHKLAVIGIDLDRFKEINDLRGHATGDLVLQTLSTRMAETLKEGEFVARFGGDEFAAVKHFSDQDELMDFAARLEACLFGTIAFDGFEVSPGASMGIAIHPDDATSCEQLINNADLAMYRAKASITETVCFYEARMDEAVRVRRSLAKELWNGIDEGQFSLFYQVQKSVSSGDITGYEVLLRWRHPERGLVPPSEFIPIAEECGAILPLGEWVLRTACLEAARWPEPYKIAVNLSAIQMSHGDLVGILKDALAKSGLAPSRLELEITESTIIADKERALHLLREIKALGVTVAIDDFGTGYSSLDTLRSFPFDKIKLDRTFMTEIESSQQAKAIIRAILALGRSLEVPVLAEGVETSDQLALLKREGCDEAQGYLLGRPKPRDAISELAELGENGLPVASPALAPEQGEALAVEKVAAR